MGVELGVVKLRSYVLWVTIYYKFLVMDSSYELVMGYGLGVVSCGLGVTNCGLELELGLGCVLEIGLKLPDTAGAPVGVRCTTLYSPSDRLCITYKRALPPIFM